MCARYRILISVAAGLLTAGAVALAVYATVAGWERAPAMLFNLVLAAATVAAVVLIVRCELVPAARRSFDHGERLAAITTGTVADPRRSDGVPTRPDGTLAGPAQDLRSERIEGHDVVSTTIGETAVVLVLRADRPTGQRPERDLEAWRAQRGSVLADEHPGLHIVSRDAG